MLQQPHGKLCQKYVDATKQNALSRRVSGLSGGAGPASPGAIGGGSMVHRLDFDLGLHRLAAPRRWRMAAVPGTSPHVPLSGPDMVLSVVGPSHAVVRFCRALSWRGKKRAFYSRSHSSNMSVTEHINNIITSSAQTINALRILRSHGMQTESIHTIYRADVIAKLTYASSAWWGFTTATDRQRLEAVIRRGIRSGLLSSNQLSLAELV